MPIASMNLNEDEIQQAISHWLLNVHDFQSSSVTLGKSDPNHPGEAPQFFADAEGKHVPRVDKVADRPIDREQELLNMKMNRAMRGDDR